MAKQVIEKAICDFCATDEGVTTFTVSSGEGGVAVVDLCPNDAEPFRRALDVGSTRPRRRMAAGRPKTPAHKVIAIEDL